MLMFNTELKWKRNFLTSDQKIPKNTGKSKSKKGEMQIYMTFIFFKECYNSYSMKHEFKKTQFYLIKNLRYI